MPISSTMPRAQVLHIRACLERGPGLQRDDGEDLLQGVVEALYPTTEHLNIHEVDDGRFETRKRVSQQTGSPTLDWEPFSHRRGQHSRGFKCQPDADPEVEGAARHSGEIDVIGQRG